ncbi:MAG: hypothetical protein QXZ68_02480 [Candidatus Bathyarchaeia archaeon]
MGRRGEQRKRLFGLTQICYILISILTITPVILGLADVPSWGKVSINTQTVYDYLEDKLAEGSPVLIDMHYGDSAKFVLEPQLEVIAKHLFDKKCKIVFVSTSPSGLTVFKQFQSSCIYVFAGKRYGVDYVVLGYVSGGEAAVAYLADSLSKTVDKDYYNIPITDHSELPMLGDIDKAEDFALAFILSVETNVFEWYVRRWASRGVPLLFGTLSITAPLVEGYVKNGCAIGIARGQKFTAEYEMLVGRAGRGQSAIKSLNMASMLMWAFMAFGNMILIVFYNRKLKTKTRSAQVQTNMAVNARRAL